MTTDQEQSFSRQSVRVYDLEHRTELFALAVRDLVRVVPRRISNIEDVKQLVRCSGSVAANYIEANDALGRKDFRMKIRIARREAKESRLFLRLLYIESNSPSDAKRHALIDEAQQLVSILSTILINSTPK
jgi:four helix bundle protein